MKGFKTNTNVLTISHYILLILVIGVCIGIIAWVMTSRQPHVATKDILHISDNTPCVQRTVDTVKQMWNYDPKIVPNKYWEIAMNYMNEPITKHTYGICNDVAYTCRRGQIRRDCDPCVVPSARAYAQSFHIADLIQQNCGTKKSN